MSWQIGEKVEVVTDFLFLGYKITVHGDCSHEIRRWLHLGRKAMTNLDSVLKSRDVTLLIKVRIFMPMSSQWSWMVVRAGLKKAECQNIWCLWTVVLEKTLESPLDCKEIKLVNLKGNQPWILIGRTDAEAEAPILWSPDEDPTLWERPWCWERLRGEEEKGISGWDGWMVSLI